MVILLFILAFFVPRLVLILLWLFTSWFSGMFNSLIWPILGFIFMPATLLWYSFVYNYFDNSWTFVPVLGLIITVLIDLSPAQARRRYRRRDVD